jgi:hypothetical protein
MNLGRQLRKLSKGRVIAGEEDYPANRRMQKFCLVGSSEPGAADIKHEGAERHGAYFSSMTNAQARFNSSLIERWWLVMPSFLTNEFNSG